MITLMEVFNPRVATSPLPLIDGVDEDSDPIQIKKIDGLGPVVATINTEQYGSIDDEFFNGAFTGKRNIVLTITLNPDWATQSIEQIRAYLYQYFMPKSQITLRFTSTHMPQVEIDGYVETFEPNLFDQDAEYQISIICPKAAFKAVQQSTVQGLTLDYTDSSTVEVDYEGTLPTGFVLTISANTTVTTSTGEFRFFNTTAGEVDIFTIGDETVDGTYNLVISTVRGDKYARRVTIATGDTLSKLGDVDDSSTWFSLQQGTNELQIQAEVGGQDWVLTYTALYGGI